MSSNNDQTPPPLSTKLKESIQLISTSPEKALTSLLQLQTRTSSLQLFSKNETLQDVTTSHIPLLCLNHYIGVSLIACPTTLSKDRYTNIMRAVDLFHAFLQTLDRMDALPSLIQTDYRNLLDRNEADQQQLEEEGSSSMSKPRHYLGESRETKIARFQCKRAANEQVKRLEALQQRRVRLHAEPEEEMDGYDDDGIKRTYHIAGLHQCSVEALEEIYTALRELEMLKMAVQMEQQREVIMKHTGKGPSNEAHNQNSQSFQNQYQPSTKPLQVTNITQDPNTGKLSFQKEQIQSQIFRPSWNQPTMSLEQLADIEISQAQERSQRQTQAEQENRRRPRRYDQLVRDGMEDDAELVELSADLDRRWDTFKEENPRGCGNKNSEKGDRNF